MNLAPEEIADLIAERNALRRQVRRYREVIAPPAMTPEAWRLSAQQERLLLAIHAAGNDGLHHEPAMLALGRLRQRALDIDLLRAVVVNVRRKLKVNHTGIVIETIQSRGWRLTPESRELFDRAIADEQARWDAARRAAA